MRNEGEEQMSEHDRPNRKEFLDLYGRIIQGLIMARGPDRLEGDSGGLTRAGRELIYEAVELTSQSLGRIFEWGYEWGDEYPSYRVEDAEEAHAKLLASIPP